MTMYPARVTELPNPAMQPPAIRIRPPAEPLPEPQDPPATAEETGTPEGPPTR